MKTCTACGVSKPMTEFGRSSIGKDGRRARCLVCSNAKNHEDLVALKLAAFHVLGDRCLLCDERRPEVLQIDHVLSDGADDRRAGRGTSLLYREIVRFGAQGKYQLLCANHNWIKYHQKREYRRLTPLPSPGFIPTDILYLAFGNSLDTPPQV